MVRSGHRDRGLPDQGRHPAGIPQGRRRTARDSQHQRADRAPLGPGRRRAYGPEEARRLAGCQRRRAHRPAGPQGLDVEPGRHPSTRERQYRCNHPRSDGRRGGLGDDGQGHDPGQAGPRPRRGQHGRREGRRSGDLPAGQPRDPQGPARRRSPGPDHSDALRGPVAPVLGREGGRQGRHRPERLGPEQGDQRQPVDHLGGLHLLRQALPRPSRQAPVGGHGEHDRSVLRRWVPGPAHVQGHRRQHPRPGIRSPRLGQGLPAAAATRSRRSATSVPRS